MAAFKAAKQARILWLEFDVTLSQDNYPVIFHDQTLNRTTNGKGNLADNCWKDLQKLDAGAWFSKAYQGETIPSLETVLLYMKKNQLNAVIDIKASPTQTILTTEKTIQLVKACWPEGFNHLIFASFSLASLITVRRHLPQQPIGFAVHEWNEVDIDLIQSLDCFSIHVNHRILSEKRINFLKTTGCYLLAYTVNKPSRAAQLRKLGIDGFFSDCPEDLLLVP